jgi:hypothetical protein
MLICSIIDNSKNARTLDQMTTIMFEFRIIICVQLKHIHVIILILLGELICQNLIGMMQQDLVAELHYKLLRTPSMTNFKLNPENMNRSRVNKCIFRVEGG